MTAPDIERRQSGQPPESPSIETENTPLLVDPPDSITTYKTTSLSDATTGPISQDENAPSPKSAAAIISLLLIGVFISNADGTLVMTTYTTISSEFHSFSSAAWLTTSYTLAVCACQPIVGKLSDIYGRKGVLLVSYGIFATGSVLT